jgi:hypothetical protein
MGSCAWLTICVPDSIFSRSSFTPAALSPIWALNAWQQQQQQLKNQTTAAPRRRHAHGCYDVQCCAAHQHDAGAVAAGFAMIWPPVDDQTESLHTSCTACFCASDLCPSACLKCLQQQQTPIKRVHPAARCNVTKACEAAAALQAAGCCFCCSRCPCDNTIKQAGDFLLQLLTHCGRRRPRSACHTTLTS